MAPPSVRCSESAGLPLRRSFFQIVSDSETFSFLSSQTRLAYHLRGGQTSFQFHIAGFRSAISSAVRAYILRNPLVRGTEYWNERIRTTRMVLETSERMLWVFDFHADIC